MSNWLKFSGVLIVLIALLGFIYTNLRPETTSPVTYERLLFSQLSERTPALAHYPNSSAIIHTINDYPSLIRLFDKDEIFSWLNNNLLSTAAKSLLGRQKTVSEFDASYVYQTSYYVGNLLVTPNHHLVEVLEDKPASAYLIEYALADLRALTTRLQDVFDVPPPVFYESGLNSGLFYKHPSFPSLVGVEAYSVYLILAEIDPKNARHYALQANQFIQSLRASGTHFDFDIDYALELASRFLPIISDHPGYQGLLNTARQEWLNYRPASTTLSQSTEALPGFSFSRRINTAPQLTTPSRELSGRLIMSMVDIRLPEPSQRLYEIDLTDLNILPFALDLNARRYNGLLPSLSNFTPAIDDGYHFSASALRLNNRYDRSLSYPSQAWSRVSSDADPRMIISSTETEKIRQIKSNRSGSYWFTWSADTNSLSVANAVTTQVFDLGEVESVVWGGNDTLFFISELGLESFSTQTGSRSLLNLPGLNLNERSAKLASDDVGSRLLVITESYDPVQVQFNVELAMYSNDGVEWSLENKAEISDVRVESVAMSPDKSNVALLVSDGITNLVGSILLFDITNGIIKKDITLSDFSPLNRSIEAWVF